MARRERHEFLRDRAIRREIDNDGAFLLLRLIKGIFEQRPAVADVLGPRALRAMQMAERRIAVRRKMHRPYLIGAADRKRPLGF